MTREEINQTFWLKEDYHHKTHLGIHEYPIDRYHASAGKIHIRRMNKAELHEILLLRHGNTFSQDSYSCYFSSGGLITVDM